MVGNEADPHIHLVGEECRSDTRPGVGLENPSPKGPSSITLEEDRMRLTTTFLLAMLPLAAMACADDQAATEPIPDQARAGDPSYRGARPDASVAVACGASVVADLKLDGDLTCPGDGLFVDGDGIKINLQGHTITGAGVGVGITVRGHHDVSIFGGTIQNFLTGVMVATSTDVVIKDNGFTQNREGVFLAGASGNTIKHNTAWQNTSRGFMIRPTGSGTISTDNVVMDNVVTNNIFFATSNRVLIFSDAGQTNTLDYNLYYASRGPDDVAITWNDQTREDYDTALRAQGTTSWKVGYLPYAIVDRWQQLRLDFAYWRALDAAERNPAWAGRRAWFVADRKRREGLILHTLGELSHFVGDGGQPLHVTVHYNGWGNYPNPAGYTQARIHGPFEGALVYTFVQPKNVAARMTPPAPCDCAVEVGVGAYLAETNRRVVPLYELEKAGGLEGGDLRGARFAAVQLARSASELRDLILMAWRDSPREMIGWKPVLTADILSGRVDPYDALYTVD